MLNNISRISAIFFGLISIILSYNKLFIDDVKIEKHSRTGQIRFRNVTYLNFPMLIFKSTIAYASTLSVILFSFGFSHFAKPEKR